jgi:hypothetical protein
MKNFALVIAFVFLAAVPGPAAEISTAAPVITFEQQPQEAIPLYVGNPEVVPRCSAVDGTSCTTTGATKACTDACNNKLSCTCYERWGGTYGTTFLGRYWRCDWEC